MEAGAAAARFIPRFSANPERNRIRSPGPIGDGVVRRALALGLILVLTGAAVALAGPADPGGSFFDDDGGVHEGAIEAIALEGITRGCNPPANDLFCPDSPVTRGEMAAFLVRALDLSGTGPMFADTVGHTFEGDISRLAAAGITRGCNPPANTLFCPDATITRGQMAAFLQRAFDYPRVTGDEFSDDNGAVFEADINAIAAAGVTAGCNPPANDRYCPSEQVKRDQMASFLTRSIGLTPIQPPPRPTTTTTTTTTRPACHPSYPTVCIQPPPPDLDCKDIPYRNFKVVKPDVHGFDGNDDGVGCQT